MIGQAGRHRKMSNYLAPKNLCVGEWISGHRSPANPRHCMAGLPGEQELGGVAGGGWLTGVAACPWRGVRGLGVAWNGGRVCEPATGTQARNEGGEMI